MAPTLSFSPFPLNRERPTRMLKDFLQETNANGIGIASSKPKPASFKALAIHAVVAAVKRISFPSVKSTRIFPRSLSRRLLRKTERDEREMGGDFVVKIKDIIRWRSFRDLVDETAAEPSLEFADSPDRYTAAATTTTTTTTTTSSYSSSWCESDFTAEDLPSPSWRHWSDDGGGGDGEVGKMYFPCVGEDSTKTTSAYKENDKKVDVNASSRQYEKEEPKLSDESTQWLLEHVKEVISLSESRRLVEHCGLDWLLLELFRRKLAYSQDDDERAKNNDKIRAKKDKEDEDDYDWFLSHEGKETYMREMEREGKWEVFDVGEKIELGLEIEGEILGCLVDEILLDTFQL